jgi:GTPase SAR1 family protein
MEEVDYVFKLIVIGNSSVGKSSIVHRFIKDESRASGKFMQKMKF